MRILISGAGVAGPALAWWLSRYGMKPTVVERSPSLRVGGHAVDIRGAAIDVIERMGLHAQVSAARTQLRTLSVVHNPRKPPLDIAIPRSLPGFRDLEIVRDDLSRILYEASRGDAEYMFGDAVATLDNARDEVRVTFASGQRRVFDVLVGADGQHSVTRKLAFGPEAAYTHKLGGYLSIFGLPNLLQLEDRALLYNEPGRTVATYSMVGNQRAKAVLGVRSAQPYESLRDEAAQKHFLQQEFQHVGWQARRILDELPTCSDFYFDEVTQIHMPRWSNGRVVLLGDAAYGPSPLSGQGTTLALVGAYVLAQALVASLPGSQLTAAFDSYEQRMRPYVEPNQALASFGLRALLPNSKLAIGIRNLAVRAVPLLMRLGIRSDKQIQRASHAIELPAALPAPQRTVDTVGCQTP
jgi:2-polyprenyl-6-methoxyphenol hydroxylase-like FAD-dependent oxidoreductase